MRLQTNFARLIAALNNKLRRDQPKQFGPLTEEESAAVASLNKALISTPVLVLPKRKGWYTLNTNDCDEKSGF